MHSVTGAAGNDTSAEPLQILLSKNADGCQKAVGKKIVKASSNKMKVAKNDVHGHDEKQ